MVSVPPTADDLAAVDAARAQGHAEAAEEAKEPVAHVEDVLAGHVPARFYIPADAGGTLLYLHGGGFALGDLVTHDGVARRLANRTGWAVLLVDYRRSPEHAWPAADRDCAAAGDWLAAQGLGRLALVGDSAGAALALGETLRHPGRYASQVLVYPFLDPTCASYDHDAVDVDLDIETCRQFWRLYLQGADVTLDPVLHALDRGSLAGLPPTLLQLAELDVLTPLGHRLAQRLTADGVPTEVTVLPGVGHGFWRRTDNRQAEGALAGIAGFLAALP